MSDEKTVAGICFDGHASKNPPMWPLSDDALDHLVLLGAGGLGRKIARTLRQIGHQPLAFCDNNRALWGTEVEGLRVFSPASAAKTFPEAAFMITIWHPSRTEGLRHHMSELQKIGCKDVTCFIPLFWRFPDLFLPNMFWEVPRKLQSQRSMIDSARELLDDDGKQEFERQLHLHLRGDVFSLKAPASGLQYFPEGAVKLAADETFVDCGAYDGDTIRDFMEISQGRFRRIIALEPDAANFQKLAASISDDRVLLHRSAAGARSEVLRLSSSGASSSISQSGANEVNCIALDDLLADESPTFIKMDIEGSEIDALRGAAITIRRCRPKMAICVYHRPSDLWEIPLLLKELLPDSHLTLRSHMLDGFDTVCYCIPEL